MCRILVGLVAHIYGSLYPQYCVSFQTCLNTYRAVFATWSTTCVCVCRHCMCLCVCNMEYNTRVCECVCVCLQTCEAKSDQDRSSFIGFSTYVCLLRSSCCFYYFPRVWGDISLHFVAYFLPKSGKM